MRYYQIQQDSKYINEPRIKGWYSKQEILRLKKREYQGLKERMLFRVKESTDTIFMDVLTFPLFLVSEKLQKCMQKYEPNLHFRTIILLDQVNRQVGEYFLPELKVIDCMVQETSGVMDKITIDPDEVKDTAIFTIAGEKQDYIIARLDIVESFYRRNVKGLMVEEVEIRKGGMQHG